MIYYYVEYLEKFRRLDTLVTVLALIFSILENGLISGLSDSLASCHSGLIKGIGVIGLEAVTNALCRNEI